MKKLPAKIRTFNLAWRLRSAQCPMEPSQNCAGGPVADGRSTTEQMCDHVCNLARKNAVKVTVTCGYEGEA